MFALHFFDDFAMAADAGVGIRKRRAALLRLVADMIVFFLVLYVGVFLFGSRVERFDIVDGSSQEAVVDTLAMTGAIFVRNGEEGKVVMDSRGDVALALGSVDSSIFGEVGTVRSAAPSEDDTLNDVSTQAYDSRLAVHTALVDVTRRFVLRSAFGTYIGNGTLEIALSTTSLAQQNIAFAKK